MNVPIRMLIVLSLIPSYLIAMSPEKRAKENEDGLKHSISAPSVLTLVAQYHGTAQLKIKVHYYKPGNDLKKNWIIVGAFEHTPFNTFKTKVAIALQVLPTKFTLNKAALKEMTEYDQNSTKTLQELGITPHTLLWAENIPQ